MNNSNQKRKIFFLVTEDWYFWSHRLPLAKAAIANGYEVVLATRVTDHGKRITDQGIRLIHLGLRRRSKNPFHEFSSILELIRIYKAERPDLVHHVALKPVLYGSIAARICGIKSVVNAVAGLGYVFVAAGVKGVLLRSIMTGLYKLAFSHRNCKGIFQNPEDNKVFINRGIIRPEQSVLIRGSGVDTKLFSPVPEADGVPKIILASRMLWDKGVGELVEAARILKRRSVAGSVILVGQPDPENPASIPEKTLTRWNSEGVISWLGFRDDVAELLNQSHIAVLPSSYGEGVPKGLLEAAAAGLPLIATDMPGCREVVRPDVNGFLVPPRDPEGLARALNILLQDREMRRRMGRASREIAVNEFSEEQVVDATLSLYEDLLSGMGKLFRPHPLV